MQPMPKVLARAAGWVDAKILTARPLTSTMNAPSLPPSRGRRDVHALRTPGSSRDWIKLARIGAIATLFTAACLANLHAQSVRMLEQLHPIMGWCSEFDSSVSAMWRKHGGDIMKASHLPERHANDTKFTGWIDDLFRSEYGPARRLRPSAIHPPDHAATMRILQIINDRVEFLKVPKGGGGSASASASAKRISSPPLHLLVMGGSVTAGMGCGANPAGLKPGHWANIQYDCAWPNRLEKLFNDVLFRGEEVVKVSNLAVGGSSSEVGKVVMEYRLFSEEMKRASPPHVVIWAHAANDSQEKDNRAVDYEHLPGFVRASRNLRLCDEDLPLVVLLDEFYGVGKYADADRISAMLYKASSWYGLMGVSHSNVVRRRLIGNYGNESFLANVLGNGDWALHPGMGAHLGIAWTLFFNFIKAFSEGCEDGRFEAPARGTTKNIVDNAPHVKYLGRYKEDETVESLHDRWKQKSERMKGHCLERESDPANEVCTYAWMVNPMAGISDHRQVWVRLKDYVVFKDGWDAIGHKTKHPRAGWYAQKKHAKFTMKVVPTLETKYVTIMSMVSYGEKFVGAKLALKLRISKSNEELKSEGSYEISGYHPVETSIHVPHKFELPGGGAVKGDTIVMEAELVQAAYFKINGIAFCAY